MEKQTRQTGLQGGLAEVERAPRCRLACDRGWRGVAPSVAVFQCTFSLGTSFGEVNTVLLYVTRVNEWLQSAECVGRSKGRRK